MHSTAGNKIDKYCSTGGAGRRIAENGKILWCTALVELFQETIEAPYQSQTILKSTQSNFVSLAQPEWCTGIPKVAR